MTTDEGMPSLDGGETVWCEGCRKLKKEVNRLQEEHAINYQTLKQKIISTDLLIRKYRTKCEEYDLQHKHMEEQSHRLERTQLDCEMLETQLKASLQSTEPLRQTRLDLEAKLKVKDTEIQTLKNSLEGAEMIQKQYEALIADNNLLSNEEERRQIDKKIQNLESSNQRYSNNLKSTKEELRAVKSEISRSSKNYKLLETKHQRILTRLEKYWNLLKQNDLLPAGDRKPPRANYNSGSEDIHDEADFYSDNPIDEENKNNTAPSPAHDLDLGLDHDFDEDIDSGEVVSTKTQPDQKMKIVNKTQPVPKNKQKKKGKNKKKNKLASSDNTEDTEGTTADEHKISNKHKREDNMDLKRASQRDKDDREESGAESSDFGDDFVGVGLSSMKYFFTFSPISAPVSPLPPSPAPGKTTRSSASRPPNLDDTDDSMDKMAASLQSRLHDNTSVRRSPRLKEKTDSSIFSSEDEQESSRTPNMKGSKKSDIKPSPKLQNKLNFTGERDREGSQVEDDISITPGSSEVNANRDQELKEKLKKKELSTENNTKGDPQNVENGLSSSAQKDDKIRGLFDRKGSLPFAVHHLFKEVGRSDNIADSAGSDDDMEMENGADIDVDSETSVDTVKENDDVTKYSPKKTKSFSPKPCERKTKDPTFDASPSRMTRSMSHSESENTELKIQSPRPKSAMARQTFLTPPPPRSKRLRAVSPKVGEEEGRETRRKRTVSLPSDLSDLEPMRRSPRLRSSEKEEGSPLGEKSRSRSEDNLNEKAEKLEEAEKQETISEKSPVRMLRSRSIEPSTESSNKMTSSPKSPITKTKKNVPSDQEKDKAGECVPNDKNAMLDKTTKANIPKRAGGCVSKSPEDILDKPATDQIQLRRTKSKPTKTCTSADSSESDIFVEKEAPPKCPIRSPPLTKSANQASKSDILTSSDSECKSFKSKGSTVTSQKPKDSPVLQSTDSESSSSSTLTFKKKTLVKRKQTPPKSSDSESDSESEIEAKKRSSPKKEIPRKARILSSSESENEVAIPDEVSSSHPCPSESEEEKMVPLPRTRTRSSTALAQSSDSEKQEVCQTRKRKPVSKSEPSARRTVRKKNNESVKLDGPKEFKSKEFISTESDTDDEDDKMLDKTQNNNIREKPQNPEVDNFGQTGDGPRALPPHERSRVLRGRGKNQGRGRQTGPPGKLYQLKASTYPSLTDSFRKVETIQDGKVSRVPDPLSKDLNETSQNITNTKPNTSSQDETRINTLNPPKETESESDRSSGHGYLPLSSKRARQLRHKYKPIVSDKDFADIILERRRITRSVSDGSSSEAKKSEAEDKEKMNERNVNISKRTEKFVERLKHSAERVKSENILVKGNKKVFSTVPKQTIIAPTRRNIRSVQSSASEVEVMDTEISNTKPNVITCEQSGVSSGLVKDQSVSLLSSKLETDVVQADTTENENECTVQKSGFTMDNSVSSQTMMEENVGGKSDDTKEKNVSMVQEKNKQTTANDHTCPTSESQRISSKAESEIDKWSVTGKVCANTVQEKSVENEKSVATNSLKEGTCSVSKDQSVSSPLKKAEPEIEKSSVTNKEIANTVQNNTTERLQANSTRDGPCPTSEGEGVTEMEVSETIHGNKTLNELKDQQKRFMEVNTSATVSLNSVKDKQCSHVSSASEMEGINSESDIQYTESDVQTSDVDTIQVFVYQDASQTSASESVVESPVKSPKSCMKSPVIDKDDSRTSTSEGLVESPQSSYKDVEKGKVPVCETGVQAPATKSVVESIKSSSLKSATSNMESSGKGDAETVQVTEDPAKGKVSLHQTCGSESVQECPETDKPVEQCSLAPSVSTVVTSCDKESPQIVEEQTDNGSENTKKAVEASDEDICKSASETNSASQTSIEKASGLLDNQTSSSAKRTEKLESRKGEEIITPRRRSSRQLNRNSAISDDYPEVETLSTPVTDNSTTLNKIETENKEPIGKDTDDTKKLESSSVKTDQVKNKSMVEAGIDVVKSTDGRGSADDKSDKAKITIELNAAKSPIADENHLRVKTRRRMKNSVESEPNNNSPRNDSPRREKTSVAGVVDTPSGQHEVGRSDGENKVKSLQTSSGGENQIEDRKENKEESAEPCFSEESNGNMKETVPDSETKVNDSQGCPKVMCDPKEKKDFSEEEDVEDLASEDVDTIQEVDDKEEEDQDTSVNSAPEMRQKPKKRVTIKRQMSFDQDESKAGEDTISEKKSKTDLKKKRKNLRKSSKNKEEDWNNLQKTENSVDHVTSKKQTKELFTVEDSCREGTSEITGAEELDLDLDEDSDDSAKKKKVETQCSFGFSVNASTSDQPQESFSLLDSLNLIPELEEGEEEDQEFKSDLGSLDPERTVSPEIVSITQKSCFTSISALIRDELRSTASTSSPLPPSPMNFFQITAPVSPLPSSPAPSRSRLQKVKKSKGKKKSKKLLETPSTSEINPCEAKMSQTTPTITKVKQKKSEKKLETPTSETTNVTSLEPKTSKQNLRSRSTSDTTPLEEKMSKQDSEVQPATEMQTTLHLDEAISSMSGSQRRIARVAKKQTDLPNFGAAPTTTLRPKPVYSRTKSGEGPSAPTGTSSMSLAQQQLIKRQQNEQEKEMRMRKRKSSESETLPVKKQVLAPPTTAGNSHPASRRLTQYLESPQEDTTDSLVDKWCSEQDKTVVAMEIFRESVKVLQACKEDQRHLVERWKDGESRDDEEVMMTNTEIRLLDLLTCLLHKHECPGHQLMELLWNSIFLSCTSSHGRLSLCRMFTALCRHEGDVEQVRVFVYKLVTCGYLSYVQPVLAVAGVWPLSLSPGPDPSAMSLVVHHLVLNACQAQSAAPDVKKLGPCFMEICGWSPLNETPGQLLSRIIEKLKLAVTADMAGAQFETMKSIELLIWSHGWRFIYMSFVNQHLTSVCDAWKAKGDNSNINPKYAITLLRIFGNLYQLPKFTQKHKEFSKALKRCLIPLLDVPTKHSEIPMCCAKVLAELSPLHPHFIMDILSQWFKKHRSEVPASVRDKLEQTRHFIATKISPFNVDSFV